MKHKITSVIFRMIIFFTGFSILLLAFWSLQGYFKKNGTAKVNADNIDTIHNISASGITAYLFDHYYFPANQISFSDEILFSYCADEGGIQYQDNDGNWVVADTLHIQPSQDKGRLVIPFLPGRVDYTIGMACMNPPEDPLSFPCTMQYSFVSESKFKYSFCAPYMEVFIYFQDESHPGEGDEFFIEFSFQECVVTCMGEEIKGPLRLLVWNKSDSGFQGDIWGRTGFIISSVDGSSCITDTFSGSASIEDVSHPDRFFFTFANEVDADIDGTLSFRYGSNNSEYELHSERLYLHADPASLERDKAAQRELMGGYLSWGNGQAWLSYDSFEPNLKIESNEVDGTRITLCEFDCTVDCLEINGVNLFPNLKTFLVDNAMDVGLIGLITGAITFMFPEPEKLTLTLPERGKKKGKFLKSSGK